MIDEKHLAMHQGLSWIPFIDERMATGEGMRIDT